MTRLTRADLDGLPAYVPGRSLADLTRELGIAEAIKLASNEVPYGPLPGVPEAVFEAMQQSHRYPDMGATQLRDALAERYGVTSDRIVTGCGSVALAEILVKATCLPGDEIVYAWRSFEAYPIISHGVGATSVRVPNTAAHGHDL
ncbi:MAG: aminotransferase class I/II-fold pyridoxal phosphate-dependent enzyme, partial [Actinoplanes sp.]